MRIGVQYGLAAAGLLAALAVAAAMHWVRLDGPAFPLDDAYIVLHNVKALTEGDASFPGVPPLYGATSLLHTLAVTALSAVMPAENALWALSWLALAAAALGALSVGRGFGLPAGWSLALAVAMLVSGSAAYVLLNGLETGWTIAAVLWTFALFQRDRASPAGALLCGLLPFLRPELGLVSAVLMSGLILDGWRGRRAETMRAVAICVLPALALLAVQWALSGSPLPRTGFAKRAFFAEPEISTIALGGFYLRKLAVFLAATGGLFAALLLPAGTLARRATLVAALYVVAAGALYPVVSAQNGLRLHYVLMPLMAVCLAALAAADGAGRRRLGRAVIAVALAVNLHGLSYKAPADLDRIAAKRETLEGVASWIEARLAPGEPLLLHDVGFVAWATEQPLIDLVGLKSPEAHAVHARITKVRGAEGMGAATDEIARAGGARTLMTSAQWNDALGFVEGLRARGWRVEPISDGTLKGYAVHRLTPP